jgi:hypothetical protein
VSYLNPEYTPIRPAKHWHEARRRNLIADFIDLHKLPDDEATRTAVAKAVADVESRHPVLDWLTKVDWVTLLALVLKALPLFLALPPEPQEPTQPKDSQ